MAQNFIACDREQELLLPPSLREWLPADHPAWFVLDEVDAMDLKAFFAGYRDDGWGRAARDPAMMPASGGAGRQDQPHRSQLVERQDAARMGRSPRSVLPRRLRGRVR